jgi:hypothetical protein
MTAMPAAVIVALTPVPVPPPVAGAPTGKFDVAWTAAAAPGGVCVGAAEVLAVAVAWDVVVSLGVGVGVAWQAGDVVAASEHEALMARVSKMPAETATGATPVARVIISGLSWVSAVPSPSSLKVLSPQAYGAPLASAALAGVPATAAAATHPDRSGVVNASVTTATPVTPPQRRRHHHRLTHAAAGTAHPFRVS